MEVGEGVPFSALFSAFFLLVLLVRLRFLGCCGESPLDGLDLGLLLDLVALLLAEGLLLFPDAAMVMS